MQGKTINDLTKEEIGLLFPVEIYPYDANWPKLFEQERQLIEDNLSPELFSLIEHFGSTSVPGLSSKDTIDILMEVEFDENRDQALIQQMKTIGYDFNWQDEGGRPHMVFVKGYDPSQPKLQTYHIHAGPANHPLWDRLHFRNYLIENPAVARAYEALKKELSVKYKHERVDYRIAKTEFVKEMTEKAKEVLKAKS